jgi:hypothetical protein
MAGDADATRFLARRSTLLRALERLASRRVRRRYPSLPLRSLELHDSTSPPDHLCRRRFSRDRSRRRPYNVDWSYAFRLRSDKFPGYLGSLGPIIARPRGAAMAADNRGGAARLDPWAAFAATPWPASGGDRLTRQPAAGATASG